MIACIWLYPSWERSKTFRIRLGSTCLMFARMLLFLCAQPSSHRINHASTSCKCNRECFGVIEINKSPKECFQTRRMVNLIKYLILTKYRIDFSKNRKIKYDFFLWKKRTHITLASVHKLTFTFAKPIACECHVMCFQLMLQL
jgi:hypothetical protein